MSKRIIQTPTVLRFAIALAISAVLSGCDLTPRKSVQEEIIVFHNPTDWQAVSKTALAITGDITLSDKLLTFSNKASIDLEPLEHDAGTGQTLFKVTSRTNPKLLNDNLFCGQQPVDYLVVKVSGDVPAQSDMQLMAYYAPKPLNLADLPLKDQDDLKRMMCALYTYAGVENKPTKAP